MSILDKLKNFINGAEVASAAYVPTTPYTGSLPNGTVRDKTVGADVKALQTFLNWCINAGLVVDGICGPKTVAAIKRFQTQYKLEQVDGIFGPKSKAAAQAVIKAHAKVPTSADKLIAQANRYCWPYGTPEKKWQYKTGAPTDTYKCGLKYYMGKSSKIDLSDCGYFIDVCVRAAGLGKDFLILKGSKQPFPAVPSNMSIVHKGKIPSGVLKPGDIIRYKKKNGGQHTLMYYASGKIAEAGRGYRFPVIRKDTNKYNANNVILSTIEVIRAK